MSCKYTMKICVNLHSIDSVRAGRLGDCFFFTGVRIPGGDSSVFPKDIVCEFTTACFIVALGMDLESNDTFMILHID